MLARHPVVHRASFLLDDGLIHSKALLGLDVSAIAVDVLLRRVTWKRQVLLRILRRVWLRLTIAGDSARLLRCSLGRRRLSR